MKSNCCSKKWLMALGLAWLVSLTSRSLAAPPLPRLPEPVSNLLGAPLPNVGHGPGIQVHRDQDGAGISATLMAGIKEEKVWFGPVSLPPDAGTLRFTAALTLIGKPGCQVSAVFTSGGVAHEPRPIPFSRHAALIGNVFQDLFIAVPPQAESIRLEFHFSVVDAEAEGGLRLRYPCLTAVAPAAIEQTPAEEHVIFRNRFSRPDVSADLIRGAPAPWPAWSCLEPTTEGKAGPGLRTEQPQDAVSFVLPSQQLVARGTVALWLQPLWSQGDARPADILKLTQGKGAILIRKNHGWSFLFVLWDAERRTHAVSCDLKTFTRGQWTRIEAAWDAEKGMGLSVNGVKLATEDCTWSAPPPEPLELRLGQGQDGEGQRAPYVLDDVEILVDTRQGAL
ncbi:MAG: hypothetical protein A3K19_32035 [Lentisphaerae bacterium RIFOXYB12_FULL_65_16]|nr:MAG: hypothetical protein A3K18_10815 [Lentisphaerae bacterium RIFOXYA12_64_32]OGV88732.1 MAG: hypothetical protein A3K19_32035 [Lentisphaerae bacterium RIFOXYB12_FULL_65_16]